MTHQNNSHFQYIFIRGTCYNYNRRLAGFLLTVSVGQNQFSPRVVICCACKPTHTAREHTKQAILIVKTCRPTFSAFPDRQFNSLDHNACECECVCVSVCERARERGHGGGQIIVSCGHYNDENVSYDCGVFIITVSTKNKITRLQRIHFRLANSIMGVDCVLTETASSWRERSR